MRYYCRMDIPKEDAELLIKYLKDMRIDFEPSSNRELVHFECLMTDEEMKETNNWIDRVL